MEMFEHIGVAARLEEICLKCPGNVYRFSGMTEEEAPRTDFRTLPTRYPFYYKLNQNDFEQVLRDHLRATYGIVPEYRREFLQIASGHGQGDKEARTVIKNIDTDETEEIVSSWVIGCDGSKSAVRTSVGIDFPGDRVGVMAMMDVELEGFPFDDSWVNYFIGESLFMLVTKLPGRYWRVYLSDAGAMTQRDNPRESFQQVADEIGVPMTIGEPHWASKWEIFNNVAETYRRNRVLLCGDASHIHSPAGGQGMNGCMQDAFNLSWKLAAVTRGDADEKILNSYESERKPIGAQITAGAKATHDIVMAFGKGLDDRIATTRDPEWRDRMVRIISGISHNYRETTVTEPGITQVPGPQPGDRAPDAILRREPLTRLFHTVRDTRFTLLLVPRADSREDALAASALSETILREHHRWARAVAISDEPVAGFDHDHWRTDETGEFAKQYEIGENESRAILVRPDMYILGTSTIDEAPRLVEQLREWFQAGLQNSPKIEDNALAV
jgi:NADPH-dependent dioxygenase